MDQQWLNTYREEIGGFSNTIHSFAQGEIARKDYKGISGGFGSYAQRDAAKHMLRLRLPGGRVTPERLHFMAQAVQQYHVPFLKLTTCEAIQMHDLTPDEVPAIMEAAIPCGIITRGGGGDNPRNIQASPLTGVQPGEAFDVMPWAEAATEYLLSICRDIHMPRKLKVAFCNGVDDCVHTAFRDMGFVAQPDGTFKLYIAGGLGGGGWRMGILAAELLWTEITLLGIGATLTLVLVFVNVQLQRDRRLRAQDKELAEKKIAIMLSQIQPHFLYNILGSIEWLCETNPQKAQEATDELARFLRGNMDSLQSTRVIPASRELEHVRCYLNLERIRFGAHLRVEYAIETSDFFLPALSLQPLVENAVNYALEQMEKTCRIQVVIREEDGDILCSVADNGVGIDPQILDKLKLGTIRAQGNGVGLTNLDERLKSLYGPGYGIQVENSPAGGALIRFRVKKEVSGT